VRWGSPVGTGLLVSLSRVISQKHPLPTKEPQ
jgi:hypothetical protein